MTKDKRVSKPGASLVFNSRESDGVIDGQSPQMYILTNISTQSPCQRSMLCTIATIDLDSKGKEPLRRVNSDEAVSL